MKERPGLTAAFGVAALAAALRLPALGWLPNPAGDEGNWLRLGRAIARGEPAELIPQARFVSLAFAHAIAWAFELFGENIAAARLAAALPIVSAAGVVAWVEQRLAGKPAWPVGALLVALHPWSVFWSRTVSVPYAVAFACACVGAALALLAVVEQAPLHLAGAILVVGLGAQLSPLSLVAAVAIGGFTLGMAPHLYRSPLPWVAVALTVAHALPRVIAAAQVVPLVEPPASSLGHAERLGSYLSAVGTGLFGETTLRHIGGMALPLGVALMLACPLLLGPLALAVRMIHRRRAPRLRYALWHLGVAVVLTPLVLSAGRAWHLDRIDADRYLFAYLPGLIFLGSGLFASEDRRARLAAAVLLIVVTIGTARAGASLLYSGCADAGPRVSAGGRCYRGFRTAADGPALERVRRTVVADAGGRAACVLVADASFYPLRFLLDGTAITYVDLRYRHVPTQHDGPCYVLTFAEDTFDPAHGSEAAGAARGLRALRDRRFRQRRPLLRLHQPDGTPLVELDRVEGFLGSR